MDVSFKLEQFESLEATLDMALYGMCSLLSLLVNCELLGLCVIDHKPSLEQQF